MYEHCTMQIYDFSNTYFQLKLENKNWNGVKNLYNPTIFPKIYCSDMLNRTKNGVCETTSAYVLDTQHT